MFAMVPWNVLRRCLRAMAVVLFCLAAGCATVQNGDSRDPYEGFNRAMFAFNEGFDEAIGKPVATVYRDLLPFEIRVRVRNFFSNVQDVMIGVNNLLQGKPNAAADDLARVLINTSFGLVGLHDIASEAGLEKHNEDFGQTFAVWGMEDGPYFVWPFFGPNTLRDTLGLIVDLLAAPVLAIDDKGTRYALAGLYLVSERAELLDVITTLDEAALDKYLQRRDAYFQRRRNLIYDGNPPRLPREAPPGRESRSHAVPPPPDDESLLSPNAGAETFAPREPSNYDAVLAAPRGKL